MKPLFRGFPKTTSLWSFLFILCGIGAQSLLFSIHSQALYEKSLAEPYGFGGPAPENDASGALYGFFGYPSADDASVSDGPTFLGGTAFVAPSNPLTNVIPTRNGIKKYKVRKGDTLSSIAASFGIGIDTIKFANSGISSPLHVGQEIVLLPVSGILYQTKDGDSLELVASRYQISPVAIQEYNPDYQKLFSGPNQTVILPNAKPLNSDDYVNRYVKGLPDLKSYFVLPAKGWNWGELHDYNAVDIADSCGESIYAAAEGLVVEESGSGYWNDGYGNYIMLEHPNGTKTRYAHTEKNLVHVGDYVQQSEKIALIGNTGNTHGPTGCHLHFEVYGAKNPFAVR